MMKFNLIRFLERVMFRKFSQNNLYQRCGMGKKTKAEIYIYSHMVKEQVFSIAEIEKYHDEAIERNEILSYFSTEDMNNTELKKLLFESVTAPLRSFEKDGEIWVECRFMCITDKGRARTYKEQDGN